MKNIVILLFVITLFGCSSSPTITGMYSAPEKLIDETLSVEDKAQIRMYRVDAFLQMLVNVNVFVDGANLASLPNSSVSTITIPPGKHKIYTKMGGLDANPGCGFEFEISKGEIVYMSLSPNSSGALPIISILTNPIVCKFEIKPVTNGEGETEYARIQSART